MPGTQNPSAIAAGELQQLSRQLAAGGDLVGAIDAIRRCHAGSDIPPDDQLRIARYEFLLQHFDAADEILSSLLESDSVVSGVFVSAAELARARGEFDKVSGLLQEARQRFPTDLSIVHALLENETDIGADVLADARQAIDEGRLPIDGRRMLTFSLARYHDRQRNYDEAWQLVCQANTLYADSVAYSRDRNDAQLDAALRLFDAVSPVDASTEPGLLYLVGSPRSGGTLLQTVLAAAPGVVSVGERGALLPWIFSALEVETKLGDPAVQTRFQELKDADLAGLRAMQPGADAYVDKTPHNLHVAGLIQRIHRGARFIDVRRRPADIALSVFFHDFPAAFDYSRRLEDIVDYLEFREQMLARWQRAGIEFVVHDHNRFVEDPATAGAGLFGELELEWSDSYLDASNRRAVAHTFSSRQVRRQVGGGSADRAAHYMSLAGDVISEL